MGLFSFTDLSTHVNRKYGDRAGRKLCTITSRFESSIRPLNKCTLTFLQITFTMQILRQIKGTRAILQYMLYIPTNNKIGTFYVHIRFCLHSVQTLSLSSFCTRVRLITSFFISLWSTSFIQEWQL